MPIPAAVFLTAAAAFLGTGLNPFWPLAWIAPVPVLVLSQRVSGGGAFGAAFVAWLVGQSNLVAYLLPVAPAAMVLVTLTVPSLVFACAVLLFRHFALRHRDLVAVLGFASVWCTFEFGLLLFSPHGSFGSLAYSQVRALPIIQLGAITGVTGISLLLLLTAAALSLAVYRGAWRTAPVILAGTCVAASVGYGTIRLSRQPVGDSVRVAAVALDSLVDLFGSPRTEIADAAVRSYAPAVAQAADSGARMVVLPEKLVSVLPADLERVEQAFAALAGEYRIVLVAGIDLRSEPARNLALVFSDRGKLISRYDKIRMIPGLEAGYVPGGAVGRVRIDRSEVGIAICKDMDFPRDLRRMAGVPLVIVPAWDFVDDGPMHARMAVVRGIEGGYSIVRAASHGWVSVSDPYGRVQQRTTTRGPVIMSADVALEPVPTIYTRTGDLVGASAAIFTLLCLAFLRRRWPPAHELRRPPAAGRVPASSHSPDRVHHTNKDS